jgi:hypothetical protein
MFAVRWVLHGDVLFMKEGEGSLGDRLRNKHTLHGLV